MIRNAPIELSEQEVHGYPLMAFERQGRTLLTDQAITYRVIKVPNQDDRCTSDYELWTDLGPVERIYKILDYRHSLITASIAVKENGTN